MGFNGYVFKRNQKITRPKKQQQSLLRSLEQLIAVKNALKKVLMTRKMILLRKRPLRKLHSHRIETRKKDIAQQNILSRLSLVKGCVIFGTFQPSWAEMFRASRNLSRCFLTINIFYCALKSVSKLADLVYQNSLELKFHLVSVKKSIFMHLHIWLNETES